MVPALRLEIWVQVLEVPEEVSALAASEAQEKPALVAPFQVDHSVELVGLLDFRGWRASAYLLLVLLLPLETPETLWAAYQDPLLALAAVFPGDMAPTKHSGHPGRAMGR